MPPVFLIPPPLAFAGSRLDGLDWLVVALYLAALVAVGILPSRKKVKGADDFFLAGRSMPVWAVALSILSTTQSAATYVAVPASAYAGDLRYLSSNLGGVLGAIILALFFIPAYYRLGVGTPYQLLEARFGPGARLATSATYMVGRVFSSGSRIYVGALPASIVVFGDASAPHLVLTIAGFMVLGTVISFLGGIASVIWVDVLQVAVYLGAALATIAFLLQVMPADLGEITAALSDPGGGAPSKLRFFSLGFDFAAPGFGFDPSEEFTLLTAVCGFTLLALASHGMDQDLVQRMLTCRSGVKGAWSVVTGVLVGIPAVAIFLVLGLLLWVYFRRPDLSAGAFAAAPAARDAFQVFALGALPAGLAGLFVAGLFAVGPAGINSSLNAMASTLVSDFYRPLRPVRDERHYLRVGRLAVAGWGLVLGLFATLCIPWQESSGQALLPFVLSIMSFAYAGLLGVFFTALFTRRGSTASAVAALAAGFVTILLFQPMVWAPFADWFPSLFPGGSSVDGLKEALPWLRWAFPWQLPTGAAVAFLVCLCGSGRGRY